MRYRAATFAALALAAAVACAAQRDTRLRRWLVPRTAPPAEAALGRLLPDVRLAGATFEEAVAELSRLGGVPVRVDPGVYIARGGWAEPINVRLRNLTLGEALAAVLSAEGTDPAGTPVAVARGGELVVLMPADARKPLVVRAYDVADLLPPDGPPVTDPDDRDRSAPERELVYGPVAFELAMGLNQLPGTPGILPRSVLPLGATTGAGPRVMTFGDRVILAVPEVDADRPRHFLDALRRGERPLRGFAE